ncbi:aldose epimerase family protein [Gracilibacillus sp. S3-1-1]|uniref:Aldose epimerase family protein n=1 Tax=Gracilibacillus pellucidus TaxID=3095368 RepID=A0ACC6M2G1_9BACI|nr:aldose epimerase family protein [Gracilibacillus sp. S3-1-1]MDX8045127.1 aldose epimerase family protein [Gracilibacillus sp. S3-1-1]
MEVKTDVLKVADQEWKEFTLINDHHMSVSILNFGGIITKIFAPNRDGKLENVVLGFKNYEDYLDNPGFFGALIGRVAGRIEQARFEIDGKSYTVPKNEGDHHLHGGEPGFHKSIWNAQPFENNNEVGLTLTLKSEDGANGYPGNVTMTVTYTLNNDNAFTITYEGTADQKTVLTSTNHSYFNLSGNLQADIQNHEITLDSSKFVELDDELIPTGNILDVDDTVYDFRNGRLMKDGVTSDYKQNLIANHGYDHYFLFDHSKQESAVVYEKESGRTLTVTTDQPGVVMYTSNNLPEGLELPERESVRYLGLCLETQASPASIHHEGFPSVWLDKDEKYFAKTTFTFGVK